MPDGRLLGIYLNDHLAGATVGVELVRRARRNNSGTEFGRFLEGLERELEEDRRALEQVIERLGFRPSSAKRAAAVVAERAGRLKLNGRIVKRSPLSQFQELDVLVMGIEGKVLLWQNLRDGAGLGARLPDVDFERLVERAREQRALLEPLHARAAREALRSG